MMRLSRCLVQYYTALRLSAGAAMLFLPFETPGPRVPIVRSADTDGPEGFDRREVIVEAGVVRVVTLPMTQRRTSDELPFQLN